MKTLRVIARLNVGGPARHVVLLDRGLRARGHDTLLAHGSVGDDEASLEHLAVDLGVPTLKIPELGRRISPLSDARALLQLVRTVFREAPDVIHTHTAKAGTLGRLAAVAYNATRGRQRRALVVHTFHGHVFEGYFGPHVSRLVRTVERLLAHATDCIITISPAQRSEIVERFAIGRRDQTAVVPLGLDLDSLLERRPVETLRSDLGIDERSVVFGYVGRLVPIKDLPTLVRAFARLLETLHHAHLLIVGDGPVRADLERLIAGLGVERHVRLLGWRQDLERVYATVDIAVLSSRNEGTPVALIEAMAAGRPAIATRVGGVPDVIADGETGLLVPPGDVHALAEAMARLGRDSGLRSRMGALARDHVAARFRHERLVSDVERLYAAGLAEKRQAVEIVRG